MFQQLAAGLNFSLICTDGGTTFGFGEGTSGQLGNVKNYQINGPPSSSDSSLPSMIVISNPTNHNDATATSSSGKPLRVVQVAAGDHHSACITADGSLYTWGLGSDGRLGHGKGLSSNNSNANDTTVHFHVQPRPVDVFIRTKRRVHQVSCGADHTLAIDDTSSAYSWGRGNYGALGLGDTRSRW